MTELETLKLLDRFREHAVTDLEFLQATRSTPSVESVQETAAEVVRGCREIVDALNETQIHEATRRAIRRRLCAVKVYVSTAAKAFAAGKRATFSECVSRVIEQFDEVEAQYRPDDDD